jgi:hypothetical protein
MAMVEELYRLFKTDGDDQTDDDGGYMDKKLCPTVDLFVRWMNFKHQYRDLTFKLSDR